jgi:hypothetical protein
MSAKQRVHKILSGQYIPMTSLTLDLKIKSGHLLCRMYEGIKFDVDQVKGSQDI